MSSPAYCKIEGMNQGLITKDNLTEASVGAAAWQEQHRDEFIVQEFVQEVKVPHDVATGRAFSARIHSPVQVSKVIDKCSPLLHEALKNNEQLTKVEFTFWRADGAGREEPFYKITLENASVRAIRNHMPDYTDPANATTVPMQDVSFIYETILIEHLLGSTSSQDSWGDGDR